MAKECMLSTDKLHLGGLSVRITDRPDMTFAFYHGLKATNQRNKIIFVDFTDV